MTNNDLPTQNHHGTQAPVKTYGMRRQKKHLNETDLLAVMVAVVCLIATVITISPRMMVAWRLGLKRQVSHHGLQPVPRVLRQVILTTLNIPSASNHRVSVEHNESMPERRRAKSFPNV